MDLAGSVEARYLEPPGEVLPIMAGYFPEHCLTLSLVDQNVLFVRGVRDVRPINISISHQDGTDRTIEIKQIGILEIQYEDVGTGKRGSEFLECGILPSTSQPPYHIILSTADTVTIFPQAIPIGRMAIYRPDAQETCGVCGRTGATVIHGECNQWFHTTCGRDSQPGSSKLPVGLIGTHELCSIELCRKSITHLPLLHDPAITFKARRAGEASSSTKEAQFATKDYVTQFYSPDETVIRVWGMFPQRGWVRVRSPHSGVKDVFSRLVGQDTEKKLKKLGFREWKGERAQEFRDAEYDALREVTVRAPSIAGVLVPKPVGAGSYQDGKDTVCFFSITQFLPSQQVPFEGQVKRLVDFHGTEQSQGDRFGFSHPTLFYDQPLNVGWHNSWLDCFLALMKLTVSQDKDRHGPWEDEDTFVSMCTQLADQLLGPLNARPRLTLGWLNDLHGRSTTYKPAIIYAPPEWEWAWATLSRLRENEAAYELVEQECDEPKDQFEQRLSFYGVIHMLLKSKWSQLDRKSAMRVVEDLSTELGLEPGKDSR